jgi:ribosomal-protein-alanine N-acetyltransferase
MDLLVEIDKLMPADFDAVTQLDGAKAWDIARESKVPWSRAWVARESGSVVGCVAGWHVVDEFHVLNLTTRADRRRRGIARALMLEVLAYGRRHGLCRVLLEVRRSNDAAIALYQSLGFSTSGVRARYYSDDEDALDMALPLDADASAAR